MKRFVKIGVSFSELSLKKKDNAFSLVVQNTIRAKAIIAALLTCIAIVLSPA